MDARNTLTGKTINKKKCHFKAHFAEKFKGCFVKGLVAKIVQMECNHLCNLDYPVAQPESF